MQHVLRSLIQAHRNRQTRLARGIARIDELNRSYPDGSYCSLDDGAVRRSTAWEDLFSKEEWRKATAGHEGRCSCCGSSVKLDAVICGACGATWREANDHEKTHSKIFFGITSITLSTAAGYISGELFIKAVHYFYDTADKTHLAHDEFLKFIESYTCISTSILLLLLCTYIYEKGGVAPKGKWMPPTQSQEPETEQLPDLDDKQGSN